MQSNLITFFEEGGNYNIDEIKVLVKQRFNLVLQNFMASIDMPLYSNIADIDSYLNYNSVILLSFKEQRLLYNLDQILSSKFSFKTDTEFGLFYKSNNFCCSVINLDTFDELKISAFKLKSLYNMSNIQYFNMFGISQAVLIQKLNEMMQQFDFDYSIYSQYGLIQVSLLVKDNAQNDLVIREFCQNFNQYILNDDGQKIEDSVAEILGLRNARFGLVDFVSEGVVQKKLDKTNVNQFIQEIMFDDYQKLNTVEGVQEIVQKYNLDFVVMVLGDMHKFTIVIVDSNAPYKFTQEVKKNVDYTYNYIYNTILVKIFDKMRKNALYFS